MILESELYRKIADACQVETAEAFRLQSRIHRLRWFGRSDIWVKRDDELGFGVSGTKLRKHASLIPALKKRGIEEVVVIGGAHSNNVLSAAQTLTENNIRMTPFSSDRHLENRGTQNCSRCLLTTAKSIGFHAPDGLIAKS